ncbi:MAG: cbb3-type cytochrome c oxidase subunit I [Armatimonadetes bacterium]|nr:cbb3-type cytochrome c oxidase subunit I [Armatimonadota bacterium]
MSKTLIQPREIPEQEELNYLNNGTSLKSWLLTGDHKRIAVLYLIGISFFFFIGSIAAGLIRLQLMRPTGVLLENDTYNKVFTAHGIVMIFFFLVPSIPAVFGNFFIPLMIGARDLAFPRLNLLSWYVYMLGGVMFLAAMLGGGVDTGWTFYVPLSSMYSNTNVSLAILAAFMAGMSSILTGVNFIATIHKMRAPGMTWGRLPLFVWAHYATSIIMVLGTPVVAITLVLVLFERTFKIGIFSPELGGDPVLFQHMFWFYSHPAVYIMVLPGMGVQSELIANFCRKKVFGYHFIAISSLAIAALGFLVWGHHMYVSSQSMYQSTVFSLLSFLVAIPSAIKIFNWSATIYKGDVRLQTPMYYALAFMGLFTIGGLTGLYLASIATDVHLTATYFVVAHFHYVMVGGALTAYLGAIHYWWPKMFGRLYSDSLGKVSALLVFVGFNLTFMPQFIVGWLGMPRRYSVYYLAPEFQAYHIMSTLGSTVLGIGLFMPLCYLTYSLFKGPRASANPWGAHGLEWLTSSPPVTENFKQIPIVTDEVYDFDYERDHREHAEEADSEEVE